MSADFIFLRPWWLAALLVVPALFILQRVRRGERNAWQQAVDPHLLPHLIETNGKDPASLRSWLIPLGAAIAIIALAGPSWQQQKAPLWQLKAPLVIAMDLSSAMLAADLAPSRLLQARAKISALLRQRRGGEVGLVAWAGDAFTAAPMTRDAATAEVVIDSLTPDLMPLDGQRADRAIEHAVSIMKSAGFERGDILLVTDHADAQAEAAAAQARAQGFRVSALGVGTASGAPMTSASGFVSDASGQVQLARLDLGSLRALAARGGGTAVALTVDGRDLDALGVLDPQGPASQAINPGSAGPDGEAAANAAMAMQRSDDGYWLVLLLLPLALLGFRRQQALAMLPLILTLAVLWQPVPAEAATPALASPAADASTPASSPSAWYSAWQQLWQRRDQRARAALASGDLAQARALAPDPSLRGAAAYRSKDYAAAAQDFATGDNADAQYNRGNALAMAGDYETALAAYDKALAQEPDMADALANRKTVEDALKQRKPPKQDQQGKQDQDKSDQGKQGESQQGQDKQGQAKQDQDQQGQTQQNQNTAQDKPGESQQEKHGQGKPDDSQQGANQQDNSKMDQGQQDQAPEAKPAVSADAQREANAAAKREMQEALARQSGREQSSQPDQTAKAAAGLSAEDRERSEHQQALQQWLRRVPDDPGGLLRWKFALEYERRQEKGEVP
ncbi:MAG: VWA domain-containing protein [Gammaproteobacteria bacterium]